MLQSQYAICVRLLLTVYADCVSVVIVRGNTASAKPKNKMQAILTKYLGATNFRGSRIKASCARGSMMVSYPYELSGDAVHVYAADLLVKKFVAEDAKQYQTPAEKNPWNRPRLVGQLPSGDHAHVFTS